MRVECRLQIQYIMKKENEFTKRTSDIHTP
jgi:hypothetical protein